MIARLLLAAALAFPAMAAADVRACLVVGVSDGDTITALRYRRQLRRIALRVHHHLTATNTELTQSLSAPLGGVA